MFRSKVLLLAAGGVLLAGLATWTVRAADKGKADATAADDHEWMLPRAAWKTPFKDDVPILFVNRNQNPTEWDALKAFWNPTTVQDVDPATGAKVTRQAVKIKVPLGLTSNPPVPPENPMTVAKWKLGKQLYCDGILSSDNSVSCMTCHNPERGFTDQSEVSTGIFGNKGGVSAPTVYNSAYSLLQFWDGRATSLEDQSQGPPQNALEMFSGEGHAWRGVVKRLREKPEYVVQFKKVFGTLPTRDTVAKAIAAYERTVLTGNAVHDRAELAMRKRLAEDDSGTAKAELTAADYLTVLKEAFAKKDTNALTVLHLDPVKDADNAEKVGAVAKSIANGRALFFGKARCNGCHIGDSFTDSAFHNLGVGAKDGKLPKDAAGRYGAQPPGHKDPEAFGAFKTPTLRQLIATAPYMHNGSERSLEEVINFYDRGGNANPYLDIRMRDEAAERAWRKAKADGTEYSGPKVHVFDGKPIVPLELKLTAQEKKDLVFFMRALQGDPADPIVADPKMMPK
ncbi:MAG: cytochrome c peroxidase [Gemmataceae bacterium]